MVRILGSSRFCLKDIAFTKQRCEFFRYVNPEVSDLLGQEGGASAYPYLLHAHGGTAWVSGTTIQGDGNASCGGIVAYPDSNMLFSGTSFSCFACVLRNTDSSCAPHFIPHFSWRRPKACFLDDEHWKFRGLLESLHSDQNTMRSFRFKLTRTHACRLPHRLGGGISSPKP